MLETEFIEKNKKHWAHYETVLNKGTNNPDELSNIYLKLSNDLSFANTHYPNRAVRLYLNNLTQKVYNSINVNIVEGKATDILTKYLPQVFYETRYATYFTLIIFIIGVLIGAFSTIKDPEFVSICLGDKYVEMTLQNINNGTPMAVYNNSFSFESFWGILTNNAGIASNTFLLGILGGVGSLFFLLLNAIMVGSFQMFFITRGIVEESIFTIWTHGTIEFLAIFFACAAGFHLGASLLFPKTYTRLQSMQIAAKRSLFLIVISILLLVLAAYIEAYITPMNLSYIVRFLFIIIPLAIYIYFVLLKPHFLNKQHKIIFEGQETLAVLNTQALTFDRISTKSKSLIASVQIYMKNIPSILLQALLAAMFCTIWALDINLKIIDDFLSSFYIFLQSIPFYIILIIVCFISAYTYFVLAKEQRKMNEFYDIETEAISPFQKIIKLLLIVVVNAILLVFLMNIEQYFIFILIIPPVLLVLSKMMLGMTTKVNISSQVLSLYISLAGDIIFFMFILLVSSSVIGLSFWSLLSNMLTLLIPMSESMTQTYTSSFVIFSMFFILFAILPILYIAIGLTYIRYAEKQNATVLLNRISNIKTKYKRYGMESEF